jgi:hypothetical protein
MTRHGTVEELTSLPYNNKQGGSRGNACDNSGEGTPPFCS